MACPPRRHRRREATQPARAISLHSAELSQFRTIGDGVLEHRWRPEETELALMPEACSDAGAATFATSIWFEDVVGHVAVPDRLRWLRAMTATCTPSTVPLDQPTTVTVRARDVITGSPVPGTVTITGAGGGATDTAFTTKFSRLRARSRVTGWRAQWHEGKGARAPAPAGRTATN